MPARGKDEWIPRNEEAEQAVIGSLLKNPRSIALVAEMDPADFYNSKYRSMFATARYLWDHGIDLNYHSLDEHQRDAGIEHTRRYDLLDLSEINLEVPSAAHIEYYAQVVREKAVLRRIIHAAQEAATLAAREGARGLETLNRVQAMFDALEIPDARNGLVAPEQWGHILVDDVQSRMAGDRTFVTTGLVDIDRMIGGGFADGTLNLLMGVTGLGKTELAFQIALHAQRAHGAVVYGSLEMGPDELAHRAARVLRDVDRNALARGTLSQEQLATVNEVANMLAVGRLWPVSPSVEFTTRTLRNHARRVQLEVGHVSLVVLDYVQRLDDTSEKKNASREQEVALMAKRLKDLAAELHCPVLALVQPNNDFQMRQDKRPILGDVRESSRLTHEADVMLGLYREEYFNTACPESQRGIMEVILLKNRSGVGMTAGAVSRVGWSGSHYRDLFDEERAVLGQNQGPAPVVRQARRGRVPDHRPTPRQEQEHAASDGGLPF